MIKKVFAVMCAALSLTAGTHAEEGAKAKLYDVVLQSFSGSKIMAIKIVREVNWMGLKDAKDLVEGAPKVVKEGLTKEEGDKAVKMLEAVKCVVELRESKVTSAERYDLVLKSFDSNVKGRVAAMIENANGFEEGAGDKISGSLPAVIKKGMIKTEAERMKLSFEDINAVVEVKDSGK